MHKPAYPKFVSTMFCYWILNFYLMSLCRCVCVCFFLVSSRLIVVMETPTAVGTTSNAILASNYNSICGKIFISMAALQLCQCFFYVFIARKTLRMSCWHRNEGQIMLTYSGAAVLDYYVYFVPVTPVKHMDLSKCFYLGNKKTS